MRSERRASRVAAGALGLLATVHHALLVAAPLPSGTLPVPSSAWVTSGSATSSQAGSTLTINQGSQKAILNWQSFNIAPDSAVTFVQPGRDATALNRIHDASPSVIQGRLTANGQVYLINTNGILFDGGSQVNVGGLIASSLEVADTLFLDGITSQPDVTAPEFSGDASAGAVRVAQGARLVAQTNGRLMLLGPTVQNAGRMEAPDGQVVLAAGERAYLIPSQDPALRGFLVEVGNGGTATNLGELVARRGNVTMAGLAVNQQGLAQATTSVSRNGSVRLLARDNPVLDPDGLPVATRTGALTLAAGSVTEVLPEAEDPAAIDDSVSFTPSRVQLAGNTVRVDGTVRATGGEIQVDASSPDPVANAQSRIYVGAQGRLDAAGTPEVVLPMSRNALEVELRGDELKDFPVQRDGILRGQTVVVDLSRGTTVADISGQLGAIRRDVRELTVSGGTVSLLSSGDVVLDPGSVVDVSGGTVRYEGGVLHTTRLVAGGRIYDIADADPNLRYEAILGPQDVLHPKWGVVASFDNGLASWQPGFGRGAGAGRIEITAPAAHLRGALLAQAGTGISPADRTGAPRGGTLVLDLRGGAAAMDVHLANALAPEALGFESAVLSGGSAQLPVEWVDAGGLASLQVRTEGRVVVPRELSLRPQPGGSVTLRGRRVDVAGDIEVAGGRIELEAVGSRGELAESVSVAGGARLSTRGQFVNDRAEAGGTGTGAVVVDGGQIVLRSQGDLLLGTVTDGALDPAVLDVGGGAWLRADGSVQAGAGGDITLSVRAASVTDPAGRLVLGAQLLGHALGAGGSLSLEAAQVLIRDAAADFAHGSPVLAAGDLADGPQLVVPDWLFAAGGFRRYSVTDNRLGLHVAGDADVAVQVPFLELDVPAAYGAPSGTDIRAVSTFMNDPLRRAPGELVLAHQRTDQEAPGTLLRVDAGARLSTDPGGAITLRSTTSQYIAGTLSAPGGALNLALNAAGQNLGFPFDPTQALWLASTATLDAAGVLRSDPPQDGMRLGEVLAGGTVSLRAERGAVVIESGARVDVSGTSAVLDLPLGPLGSPQATAVASHAGSVTLFAAEGALLDGSLVAQAGGPGAAGGHLALEVSALARSIVDQAETFPTGPRVITLGADAAPALPPGTVFGDALPAASNGIAALSAAQVAAGGFDFVELRADDGLRLTQNVEMDLRGGAVLGVSALDLGGHRFDLRAPWVQIGRTQGLNDAGFLAAPAATGGAGALGVHAGQLELVGDVGVLGADAVRLDASGDLRLRGVAHAGNVLSGQFEAAGDLTLAAAQVLPTALSRYRLSSGDDLTLEARPGPVGAPLSVGGRVELNAATVTVHGRVRAPLGEIALTATDAVTVTAGAELSTSAAGLTLPFGKTQNGSEWLYELFPGFSQLFTTPPEKRIALSGASVDVQAGALLDLAGGGDLLAYEFVPGAGGSTDVLAAANADGAFAILPALGAATVPHDAQYWRDAESTPGQAVLLDGVAGLAPDVPYMVLPARYALLPGALLVRPVAGYADLRPDAGVRLSDGASVAAGRFAVAGTGIVDARTQGFAVYPGYVAGDTGAIPVGAEYRLSTGNAFFAGAGGRLPRDAGRLTVRADTALALTGTLNAAGMSGGRGAQVDLAATQLAVLGAGATAAPGSVVLRVADLNALGAESLLLGGVRLSGPDATEVEQLSENLVVDTAGETLRAPELLLVAADTLTVRGTSVLAADAAPPAADTLRVGFVPTDRNGDGLVDLADGSRDRNGDGLITAADAADGRGALIRLAGGALVPVLRENVTDALRGSVIVEAGAILRAGVPDAGGVARGGSVLIEGTRENRFVGTLDIGVGGGLGLGAAAIGLGDVPNGYTGLRLDGLQLGDLSGLGTLRLRSFGAVDFYGDLTLGGAGVASLELDAAALVGHGTAAQTATVQAREVTLVNRGGVPLGAVGADAGTLRVAAQRVTLGQGAKTIGGFAATELVASEALVLADAGTLGMPGALVVETPLVVGQTGARQDISVDGSARIAAPAVALASASAPTAGLGARLTLGAADVLVTGALRLPAGQIVLRATAGDVRLGNGALLDVAGPELAFTDVTFGAPGGSVALESLAGDVLLDAGSRVDLSARRSAEAGRLEMRAVNGAVRLAGALDGHGPDAARSGRLLLDAAALAVGADAPGGALAPLAALLAQSGFERELALRLRSGDANLAAGSTLRAQRVDLAVDAGSLTVAGTVDARAPKGGVVRLYAGGVLELGAGARVDASRQTPADVIGQDGRIELGSTTALMLDSAARLDAGAQGGVLLRAPRTGGGSGSEVAATFGASVFERAAGVTLEAVHASTATSITTALQDTLRTETESFMAFAPAITDRLGMLGDTRFHLAPGIELRAPGDLTLAQNWDLSTWRFGGEPVALTLRAGGNLNLNASVSDGFNGVLPGSTLRTDRSATLRLVGAADLSGADPLAVLPDGAARPNGDVRLAANQLVRTGTGDIELAAARHFDLGAGATGVNRRTAALYTAGRASVTAEYPQLAGFTTPTGAGVNPNYPVEGGDVRIAAGGDVLGAITQQLVTGWQQRRGRTNADGTLVAGQNPSWWLDFGRFQQNVGALGGGDVDVRAARNVDNLSVVIPTTGRVGGAAGTPADPANLVVTGGGDLHVQAGGDIRSGVYYVGRGTGTLRADGAVIAGRTVRDTNPLATTTPVHTVLALGEGRFDVQAGGAVTLETVLNPTVLAQESTVTGSARSFFFTYAPDSAVDVRTVAGDLTLANNLAALRQALQPAGGRPGINLTTDAETALLVYPPRLAALALSGAVAVNGLGGTVTLFPSSQGQLSLHARTDVTIGAQQALFMSDTDPALLVQPTFAPGSVVGVSYRPTSERLARSGLSALIHAATPLHRDDLEPALVEALEGDLSGALLLSKPARLRAGRDVRDLSYEGQHHRREDVTVVRAGRDLVYPLQRAANGQQLSNQGHIELRGPGLLEVSAGREVDLGSSVGITTRGNLTNPALPEGGADIAVLAGGEPQYAGFLRRVHDAVEPDGPDLQTLFETTLVEFGREVLGDPQADAAQVLALMLDQQGPFADPAVLRDAYFRLLRQTGRNALVLGAADEGSYALGFAAEEAFFGSAQRQGDLRLVFSQVKTEAGGNLALLAPGGGVDVGLATPPAESGSSKTADQLGIVAVGAGNVYAYARDDFAVNEARVFTLGGGDILIWSSQGDIDAGRGAKTAVSAPAPVLVITPDGQVVFRFQSVSGSGIRSILVDPSLRPGDIDLIAPNGEVNAGDAGIGSAGNLTIAAPRVVGADNIAVGGIATGVPVADTGGLAASLSGVSSVASAATKSAVDAVAQATERAAAAQAGGGGGLAVVRVEVVGYE